MSTSSLYQLDAMRQPGFAPSGARWRAAIGGASSGLGLEAITNSKTAVTRARDPRSLDETATTGAAARSRRAS